MDFAYIGDLKTFELKHPKLNERQHRTGADIHGEHVGLNGRVTSWKDRSSLPTPDHLDDRQCRA